MLKIDIHTHIIPEKMPNWAEKFGYSGFVSLDHHKPCCAKMMIDDKFFREIQDNCWDPKTRIKDCDQSGIHIQVLSTIPVLFNYWAKPMDAYDSSRFFNDHIASICREYPTRFWGLGTIPMQDTKLAIMELERCMGELGLLGVEIGSNVNDFNLDNPVFQEIFARAEALGAAIFVHPWNIMGKDQMSKYWLPWLVGMPAETSRAICSMIFGGIFEKFPKLRVAFAHGGGSFPFTLGRIQHGFEVRPDLCAIDNPIAPSTYLGKFYVDSLVHDPEILTFLINRMGSDHVMLGSDYPFPLGELSPGKAISEMDMPLETKGKLLYSNVCRWLNKQML